MKARLESELPRGQGWVFELKLDGIRALGIKHGTEVQVFSRRPSELTSEYPLVCQALQRLPARQLVVDGEIVALDERGRSSFQLLQNRNRNASQVKAIIYYVFDLLHLNGHDLTALPLAQRRKALEALMKRAPDPLRLSAILRAPAARVWTQVLRRGLEGLIAKQWNSLYESGRRSGAWIKVKAHAEQEFVIGGYTPPEGTRKYFGSILVGYYDGDDLVFASRVGTGFDFARLRSLHRLFQEQRVAQCPFAGLPSKRPGGGPGLAAAELRRCTWLRPRLVCQVRFMEWTQDGGLRHPVFLGLREDKKPRQVVRETPAP
jgi:bifunctional non-homologous end joining protein LigD